MLSQKHNLRMADTETVEETTKLNGEDEVVEEVDPAAEQTKKKRKRKKKKKTGVVVFRRCWFAKYPKQFGRCGSIIFSGVREHVDVVVDLVARWMRLNGRVVSAFLNISYSHKYFNHMFVMKRDAS